MNNLAIVNNDFNKDKLFDNSRDNCTDRFLVLQRILKSKGWECHTDDYYKHNEIDLFLYINIKKRQLPKLFQN